MRNTPFLRRFLLFSLILVPFSGLLTACAESDSTVHDSEPKLKEFESNILNLKGVANKTTSLDFTLQNIGDADLTYTFSESIAWLEVAPTTGTLAPDGSQAITFTATCPATGSPTQGVVDLETNDPLRRDINIFISLKCSPGTTNPGEEEEEEEEETPATKADLNFKVEGVSADIHSQQAAFIHVYGPDNALVGAVGQGKLVIKSAGSYKIKADDITDTANDTLYKAPAEFTVAISEANFKSNAIPEVTVTYEKQEDPVIMADLNIVVEGLPDGVNANVEIYDANVEILTTLTESGKYTVQEASTYHVVPLDVTHNGTLYKASQEVEVVVTQSDLEQDTIAPVTVTYDNPTQVKNSNDTGVGSLREVLQDAPEGATITFAPDVDTIEFESGKIELTKNVTIDGGRKVILSGNEEHQIFAINTPIEVTLRGLTFTLADNPTGNGGAISNDTGTLVIESCLFDQNDSEQNGGAIASKDGVLHITNSTFYDNSAVLGGAIYSDSNETKILYSTLSVNLATTGGAIAAANEPGNLKLVEIGKSIIAENTDTNNSPDLYTAPDALPFASFGYNLIGDNSGSLGFIDTDNNADNHDQVGDSTNKISPMLGGLASNDSTIGTMSVGPGSPAYAQIPAAECLETTDQRGKSRPTAGFCDIGAFERGASAPGGLESFDNSTATSKYLSDSFEGNHNITWNFIEARNASTAPIADAGINIRHEFDSDIYGAVIAESIPGGIQNFSVKLRKGASGAGARQVELFINDVSYGESELFGSGSTADPTIHTFTVTDINVAGDFKLEIRHITPGTKSNGRNIALDNISWTAFP